MKRVVLMMAILLPICAHAQSDSLQSVMRTEQVKYSVSDKCRRITKAGEKLSMSAKLQFSAMGTAFVGAALAAGGASINVDYNEEIAYDDKSSLYNYNKNKDEKRKVDRKKAARGVMYGFGIASGLCALACEVASVVCKLQAGKELKMYSDGNSVSVAYNF